MDDMIYCQREIPKDKWRYGMRSSAATGCGWIAVYNALRIMGYNPDASKLIKFFEKQIPFFNGNTGTFVLSPLMFFRKLGFDTVVTAKVKKYDELAEKYDVCILYFWWRNKFKIGAHFVAVKSTPEGFVGYNTYRNSKGPDYYGKSLSEFIKNRKYYGTVLMAINNKK